MKIGITLHPYGYDKPAGLEEYISSLSQTLVAEDHQHTYVFFVKNKLRKNPDWLEGTKHEIRIVKSKFLWLDKAYRDNKDIDVWIYHNPMLPIFSKPKKSIVIALDFSFIYLKRGSFTKAFYRYLHTFLQRFALNKATKIVAISDYTKREILKWFPKIDENKIIPIYAGNRHLHEIRPKEFELPESYFLSVGVIKPRKNQKRVVQAFLDAKKRGLSGKLVVAGKGGGDYLNEIEQIVNDSEFKEEIIFTGYLNDAELVHAYKNAQALAFPSFIEGFGFPVLEAMNLGVPVITSSTSSLDEVGGDAAIKVDPESVEQIAEAFLEMQDKKTQEKYRSAGYEQSKKYSWSNTAKILLKVINSV